MPVQTHQSPSGETAKHEKEIWYFAYGSNMKSSVMKGRGITPLEVQAAVVPDYTLCFDIFGIPYSEPAFASIMTLHESEATANQSVPPVHGVAYLLTPDDYRRLVLSEGAGVGYDEIVVDAKTVATEEAEIMVHTLKAKFPFRPNRAPSKRYLGLILDGAQEFNLPQPYQIFLRSLPSYTPALTYRARFGAWSFLGFWRRAIRVLARLTKVSTNGRGHCPKWLGVVIVGVYRCMWGWHDHIYSKIWSRGDGL